MSEAVNKTEEWVLGPENTPFFTTTVSAPFRASEFQPD